VQKPNFVCTPLANVEFAGIFQVNPVCGSNDQSDEFWSHRVSGIKNIALAYFLV
jgi:hypothetical protein